MNLDKYIELIVEPIERGEYTQTTGRLTDGTNYCCLGVATEEARKKGYVSGEWRNEWGSILFYDNEWGSTFFYDGEYHKTAEAYHLPVSVRRLLGTDEPEGMIVPRPDNLILEEFEDDDQPDYVSLATLNDYGWSLEQIAVIVRQEVERLRAGGEPYKDWTIHDV